MPCELGLLFGDSREKGGKVVDRVDLILLDDFQKLLSVADISFGRRTAFEQNSLGLSPFDVTGNDVASGIIFLIFIVSSEPICPVDPITSTFFIANSD